MTWFAKISALAKRRRSLIAGALLLLLIILFFPFQLTTVPRWRLHVVDETGAHISGINVTEHWQHNLLETEGHEELLATDDHGRVEFPARTIRSGLGVRLIDAIAALARQGSKAKLHPYAAVVVWGRADYETAVAIYQPGTTPQGDIVIQRQR